MKIVPTTMKATALAVLLVIGGAPIGEPHAAADSTVDVTMSNFRYCTTPTCSPADQGYVRLSSGPVAGSDNPNSIVDVPEGSTVQWVYRDAGPGSEQGRPPSAHGTDCENDGQRLDEFDQ